MVSQETVAKVIDLLHDEGVCQEYAACSSDEEVMELLHSHDIEVDSVQELKDAVKDTISNMSEEELNGWGYCIGIGYMSGEDDTGALCVAYGKTDGKKAGGLAASYNLGGGFSIGVACYGGDCGK